MVGLNGSILRNGSNRPNPKIDLPEGQSAFLWGARKTGKSTYLHTKFPDSISFDLLKTDLALDLMRRPALLRERLDACQPEQLTRPIIIDEVQKAPAASTVVICGH